MQYWLSVRLPTRLVRHKPQDIRSFDWISFCIRFDTILLQSTYFLWFVSNHCNLWLMYRWSLSSKASPFWLLNCFNMGYDLTRFDSEVDDELKCPVSARRSARIVCRQLLSAVSISSVRSVVRFWRTQFKRPTASIPSATTASMSGFKDRTTVRSTDRFSTPMISNPRRESSETFWPNSTSNANMVCIEFRF